MALFQPTNITPSDLSGVGTIDALNDLPVTWQVNGTGNTPMTAYQIDIMMNDTESTLLYSTGQVALSNPFYGADAMGNPQYFTATITAAALAAAGVVNSKDNVYKLLITQWWSAGEYVQQSSASVFIARETPEVSITNFSPTITTVSYEFIGSYSQAQGDPIEWARWQISGSANNDVLVDTGRIYGVGELKTNYDGFLNGNNYIVRLSGQTVNGAEFDTGWQTFVADYEIEILDGAMTTCVRKDTDAVQISFPTPLYTMGAGGGDWEIEDYQYKTAGPSDMVTVDDAIEAPMKSLAVTIVPTQDLHGYDAPWAAGGGKNKANLIYINGSASQRNLTSNSVEIYNVDAGQYRSMRYKVLSAPDYAGQTLTLSMDCTGEYRRVIARYYESDGSGSAYGSALFEITGAHIEQTITIPSDVPSNVALCLLLYSTGPISTASEAKYYNIQLELGSTATSFTPYENLCPILGTDKLNMFVEDSYDQSATPKAVITLPQTVYTGTIGSDGGESRDAVRVFNGTENWKRGSETNPNGTFFTLVESLPFKGWGNGGRDSFMCNMFKAATLNGAGSSEANNTFWWNNGRTGYRIIWGLPNNGSTVEELKAFLASSNAVIKGELATPTTFATPSVSIPTPTGTATTWATAEDGTVESMEVTYYKSE